MPQLASPEIEQLTRKAFDLRNSNTALSANISDLSSKFKCWNSSGARPQRADAQALSGSVADLLEFINIEEHVQQELKEAHSTLMHNINVKRLELFSEHVKAVIEMCGPDFHLPVRRVPSFNTHIQIIAGVQRDLEALKELSPDFEVTFPDFESFKLGEAQIKANIHSERFYEEYCVRLAERFYNSLTFENLEDNQRKLINFAAKDRVLAATPYTLQYTRQVNPLESAEVLPDSGVFLLPTVALTLPEFDFLRSLVNVDGMSKAELETLTLLYMDGSYLTLADAKEATLAL